MGNDFAFICKHHYNNIMSKELNKNTQIHDTPQTIINNHIQILKDLGFTHSTKNNKLAILYANLKNTPPIHISTCNYKQDTTPSTTSCKCHLYPKFIDPH